MQGWLDGKTAFGQPDAVNVAQQGVLDLGLGEAPLRQAQQRDGIEGQPAHFQRRRDQNRLAFDRDRVSRALDGVGQPGDELAVGEKRAWLRVEHCAGQDQPAQDVLESAQGRDIPVGGDRALAGPRDDAQRGLVTRTRTWLALAGFPGEPPLRVRADQLLEPHHPLP